MDRHALDASMRAFGLRAHGGPDRLEFLDVPAPAPGPGEIRVRVHAAAFNHLDRFVLAGMPGVPIELPHVLGSDAAGRVDALGDGVGGPEVGTRVLINPGLWDGTCPACQSGHESLCRKYRILGEHVQGSLSEFVVVPARNVHSIPDALGWEPAAAAPLVYQTAWHALRGVGELKAGESVAVIGGGGGTATAAVQVARLTGAHVAVVTRTSAKAERLRPLGADAVLVPDEDHPLDRLLWEWSGKQGVDLIFDSVGRPTLPRSLRAVARGGRIVVIGGTAGTEVEIDVRPLFWRQASIRGSTMASASEFREVLGHLFAGRLAPVVDSVHPFERAGEAFARLDSEDLLGKVVVRVDPRP